MITFFLAFMKIYVYSFYEFYFFHEIPVLIDAGMNRKKINVLLVLFLGIYNSIDLLKVTGFNTMFNDGMPHAGNMIIQKKKRKAGNSRSTSNADCNCSMQTWRINC